MTVDEVCARFAGTGTAARSAAGETSDQSGHDAPNTPQLVGALS